jgi:hypothetical protein
VHYNFWCRRIANESPRTKHARSLPCKFCPSGILRNQKHKLRYILAGMSSLQPARLKFRHSTPGNISMSAHIYIYIYIYMYIYIYIYMRLCGCGPFKQFACEIIRCTCTYEHTIAAISSGQTNRFRPECCLQGWWTCPDKTRSPCLQRSRNFAGKCCMSCQRCSSQVCTHMHRPAGKVIRLLGLE